MAITRILLDTCAARSLIHPIGPQFDLAAILSRLGKYRISLADGAAAELVSQLAEGSIHFYDWITNIDKIESFLDSRWPIFPGGKELTVLAGLQTDLTIDVRDVQLYKQAFWKVLRNAKSERVFLAGIEYKDSKGRRKELVPKPEEIKIAMQEIRQKWITHIADLQAIYTATPEQFSSLAKTRAAVRFGLGTAPTDPPDLATRLDAYLNIQANFIQMSFDSETPYKPESDKRRSDVFDMSLLQAIPLPAIIVTGDVKLINSLRQSKSSGAMQVISIDEFNKHAAADTLETLLTDRHSEVEQLEKWRRAAHSLWLARGSPLGDDWRDWFDAEPIA